MFDHIICPISTEKVDSNVSRLTVFINDGLMVYFMFTLQPVAIIVVTMDYFVRAIGQNQYSPLCIIARTLVTASGAVSKMIGKDQKVFASRLGLICALVGLIFILVNMPLASRGIIGFFIVLATLDLVFDVCVGCLIYNYLVYPFYKKA